MTALSLTAALALAATCQNSVDPQTLIGIARHESGLVTDLVHVNADGSRDYGLMQINERNFSLLGLTHTTALDPCQSLAATARLLVLITVSAATEPVATSAGRAARDSVAWRQR